MWVSYSYDSRPPNADAEEGAKQATDSGASKELTGMGDGESVDATNDDKTGVRQRHGKTGDTTTMQDDGAGVNNDKADDLATANDEASSSEQTAAGTDKVLFPSLPVIHYPQCAY